MFPVLHIRFNFRFNQKLFIVASISSFVEEGKKISNSYRLSYFNIQFEILMYDSLISTSNLRFEHMNLQKRVKQIQKVLHIFSQLQLKRRCQGNAYHNTVPYSFQT
ncbi:hypothetical protein SUGI_0428040 [Cryptomeria japonica]|nr:hypothetical protein SUGI_0428040 [Cryptomeria japonica]